MFQTSNPSGRDCGFRRTWRTAAHLASADKASFIGLVKSSATMAGYSFVQSSLRIVVPDAKSTTTTLNPPGARSTLHAVRPFDVVVQSPGSLQLNGGSQARAS